MSQRALLLVNPNARLGQEGRLQALQQLQELGLELIEESAENPKALPDLIRHYRQQIDCVIVGSGDGTINAALDGLVDTGLPLGILPLGTANNLARNLGIPQSLPAACEIIAQGKRRTIDIGCVNGKYFLNVAGIGLSAEINKRVSKQFKRRWGSVAYAATALQVLWQSRPFWADIQGNNEYIRVKTVQITVCNGRYYGSGLSVSENATIDDQRLDLYCVEIQHWWDLIPLLPAIIKGKPGRGVRTLQAQTIEIQTRRSYLIDADGELTGNTPAQFQIIPQALSVFVPE
ncbi:lipid kinase [Microcoleus sp. FACHB-672]|uniref:lipid kinase n=1 Tax=Microcoleus sp. FACHB-672 TaxID=2692825 RepID=UPI00168363BC|nr:lipid kinase [Microcoleus sp. FACHB-672]MBD2043238.1 lipid kinase [Microcoleus sp. FACHB-672]